MLILKSVSLIITIFIDNFTLREYYFKTYMGCTLLIESTLPTN